MHVTAAQKSSRRVFLVFLFVFFASSKKKFFSKGKKKNLGDGFLLKGRTPTKVGARR